MPETFPVVNQSLGPMLPFAETDLPDTSLRSHLTGYSDEVAEATVAGRWDSAAEDAQRDLAERFETPLTAPVLRFEDGAVSEDYRVRSNHALREETIEGLRWCPRCKISRRKSASVPMCWQGKRGEPDALGRRDRLEKCQDQQLPSRVAKAVEQNHIRAARWQASGLLTRISQIERVQKCGLVPIRSGGIIDIRGNRDVVSFSGIAKCDNSKVCPVCSVPIQAERREQVVQVLENAAAEGHRAAMGTFTLRHHRGQSLTWLLDTLTSAFHKVMNKRKVRRLLNSMGFEEGGWLRSTEATYSEANGWHPHIHYILIFNFQVEDDELTAEEVNDLFAEALEVVAGELREAWAYNVANKWDKQRKKMVASGLAVPWGEFQDLKVAHTPKGAAEYVMKEATTAEGAAFELAPAATKKGRRKTSRTTWQILFDMLNPEVTDQWGEKRARTDKEKARDMGLWREWEHATSIVKNRRMFQTSPRLMDRFGAIATKTSEQAEGVNPETPIVGSVTDWKTSMTSTDQHGRDRCDLKKAGVLLSVFRWEIQLTDDIDASIEAVRTWCAQNGVTFIEAHHPSAEESRRRHEKHNFMPEGSLGQSWQHYKDVQEGIEAAEAFANLPPEDQQALLCEESEAMAAEAISERVEREVELYLDLCNRPPGLFIPIPFLYPRGNPQSLNIGPERSSIARELAQARRVVENKLMPARSK